MDSITPEFAFAMKAKQIKLEEQVVLQLGCVGSRSKISYGTKVPINLCGVQDQIYLDLVNIDQYNCIIGTPFMNTYGVCLNFGKCTIHMNGQEINALSFEEEQQYVDKKRLGRSRGPRPPPRETAPYRLGGQLPLIEPHLYDWAQQIPREWNLQCLDSKSLGMF